MRIGIYGGTFNPPHMGHFRAVACAREVLALDRVLLIPTNISPHKTLPADSPSPRQRLERVSRGCEGFEGLESSDIELQREGPSYTWQTIAQLRALYADAELVLLMGTDMFLSFHTWREPQRILQDAALGVFYRGDEGEEKAIEAQKQTLEAAGATVYTVKNPVVDISSTQVRRLLVLGCASEFLPPAVEDYVYAHGFYGTGRDLKNLPVEQLEAVVVSLLKPSRVAHVLGCRDTAVALAKRWGADETAAARAALLHDITKALDGPLQLTLCRSYGMIQDDFERHNVQTVHALTGSWVAKRIFGESDAVVSAIASHTTGRPCMALLDQLIYLADYIEPNRNFPGVEALRRLSFEQLEEALMLGLNMTITHLRRQGREVSPESAETLKWLQARKGR